MSEDEIRLCVIIMKHLLKRKSVYFISHFFLFKSDYLYLFVFRHARIPSNLNNVIIEEKVYCKYFEKYL